MGGSQFRFRHFTIRQDRCAMKVSTDSVILGCLTDPPPRGRILDVGTGTGLLALMMAFRGGESVDALEIEPEAAAQAAENVDASGMGGRIHVITGDFREFRPEVPYRLIISNPPYFPPGVAASSRARDLSRSTASLTHRDLLLQSSALLEKGGMLSLCVPATAVPALENTLTVTDLIISRRVAVRSGPAKPCYLEVLQLLKAPGKTVLPIREELCIRDSSGAYSEEYRRLAGATYADEWSGNRTTTGKEGA